MSKKIIQHHHCLYGRPDEELVLPVSKAEHHILTLCQRYFKKHVSENFIKAMKLNFAIWDAKNIIIKEDKP